jgi:hypothetical protein
MASIQETIPRPPVRFLSLYAHLPADGRWEGRGDTARAAEGHSLSLADASRVPGPGQGLRILVGTRPVPLSVEQLPVP